MKKNILVFCFCVFAFQSSFAQGVWTWVNGPKTTFNGPVRGTQGVPAAGNVPGSVYEPGEWKDLQGNFWLYGGACDSVVYGQLWEYNVTTNMWTWVKGDIYGSPYWGVIGAADINNEPGTLANGISTWVDLNGNLWMYGGKNAQGNTITNMWMYNIATNTWTRTNSNNGVNVAPTYGVMGNPASANSPGGRSDCNATWVDSLGNLWMYGGNDIFGNYFGDVWEYNVSLNEWAWMGGTEQTNKPPVYGTKGVADPANTPGCRTAYSSWKDEKGEFWFFGGKYYTGDDFGDMWKYDPVNNLWTWMSGSQLVNDPGNYGPQCTSSTAYYPQARTENRSRWTDDCGRFWLYGGNYVNDLWCFDPVSLKWTFVNGSSGTYVLPVYGTKGVASTTNQPGGRHGSVAWTGNDGSLYLFGGNNYGQQRNDLWRFTADPNCPKNVQPLSLGNDTSYCGPFARVLSTGNAATVWSTGATASQITVTTAGKYWASVNATCGVASDTIVISSATSKAGSVTATPNSVCSGNSAVVAVTGNAGKIQWQSSANGITFADIAGDTATSITTPILSQNTYFRVKAKGSCNVDSSAAQLINVTPLPVSGNTSAAPTSVCSGSTSQLSVTGSAGNIQWQSSSNGTTFTNIPGATAALYTSPALSQKVYYRAKTSNTCGADSSNIQLINILPLPVAGAVTLGRDTICKGSGITSRLTTTAGAGNLQWQSSVNGTDFSDVLNETASSYTTPQNLAQTTTYRLLASNSCGADTSNTVIVRVVPSPVAIYNYTTTGRRVSFNSDSSYDNLIRYHWDFGDGQSSSIANAVHTFDSAKIYYVCLTVYNNSNCSFANCKYVNLVGTGVQNISANNSIRVYPNPAGSELTIEVLNSEAPKQISITNDLGQTLIQLNTYKTKTQINVSPLAAGIYFVKTQLGDGGVEVRKFVKE